ncbi:TPA: restriction endonuclease subunit S [Vibrio parahaemolyticus]|nr:restriction endonuclease subunit S [Vibrio parahaemolyticus]
MTGRYKAYSEYKDSGIEWLKDMPSHWELIRAKHLFQRVQRPVRPQDGIVTAFRDGEVTLRSNRRTDGFTNAAKEIGYQGVRKGDLLVHAMDGFAGAIGISDSDGKCSPVCSVCIPRKIHTVDPTYFGYLVRQLAVTDYITSLAKGIRERSTEFRFAEFASLFLAAPPKEEQKKIANFLDHETAKIDTLITKQEKLIELLKEKRQAVISHAVTKGLNPDTPMKDSGVEWLGEVPEHWNILKFGITNKSAELGGNYNSGEGEEGLPLIKMGNLGRGDISLKKMEYLPIEESFDKAHLLKCGDFLFNTRNSLELVGKVSIWKNELPRALYNSNVLRISFEPTLVSSSQYMSYLFNSDLGLSQLRLIAKGTTSVAAIYYKELKSISFPLPTLKEQEEIVEYVEKNIEKLDALIKQSQKAIQLIKERKTALISAAVTGKIDVRDWDAQGVEG